MITRKNDAFVAEIVNMRLTKIFMAIFAPDDRLPSSATLMQWFLELFLARNSSCSLFLCVLPFTKGVDYGRGKAGRWSIQYRDQIRGSGRYGATHYPLTSNTLWLNLKIIEEDKHVGLESPGDEALLVTASRDLWCLWLDCGCALSPCDLCLFELGHPGAVPRYQLICLPTWIEQKTKLELKRKQKWANVF